jgi:hypothetical protein
VLRNGRGEKNEIRFKKITVMFAIQKGNVYHEPFY